MLKFILRTARFLFVATAAIALGAKLILESNADPETEDIDMVTIFEGTHLISKAETFYGGNILSMFGGTLLDLRDVGAAPTGVTLDLSMAMAGLSIAVPRGWRVHNKANFVLAGFSDATKTDANDDAPTLTLTGNVMMAGVQVANESPVKETAS